MLVFFSSLKLSFPWISAKAMSVNIKSNFPAQYFRSNYGNATIILSSLACVAGFNALAVIFQAQIGGQGYFNDLWLLIRLCSLCVY